MAELDLSQSAGTSAPAAATFVFADIAGFTALTEAHGDEQAAARRPDMFAGPPGTRASAAAEANYPGTASAQ